MHPFSHPWFCMASGLMSFKLSKLNIIVVVSLSLSESVNCGWELWPFVMKGPLSSFQVHRRLQCGAGCHGGLSRNETELAILPRTALVSVKTSSCMSWETSLVMWISWPKSSDTKELAGVWGTVGGPSGPNGTKEPLVACWGKWLETFRFSWLIAS